MATHVFEKFDPKTEDFTSWNERLSMYMDFHKIAADQQVKFFIACIGAEGFAVLKRLACPKVPKDLTIDQITALLEEFYNPKPLEDVACFQFRQRKQQEGENFATFLAALKELSVHCGYGNRLNDELKKQIIGGIRDYRTQRSLLGTPGITYDKVVEYCKSQELGAAGQDVVRGEKSSEPGTSGINKVNDRVVKKNYNRGKPAKNSNFGGSSASKSSEKNSVDVCYRCGRKNHRAPACKFISSVCNSCKQTGHLSNVCGKDHAAIRAAAFEKKKPSVKNIGSSMPIVDIGQVSAVSVCSTNTDNEIPPPKFFLNLLVNNVSVRFEIDSGADFTLMSLATCKRHGLEAELKTANRTFESYDHSPIELVGIIPVKVEYNNVMLNLRLRIVDGNYDTILGRDWLVPFNIDYRDHIARPIQQVSSDGEYADLLKKIELLVDEFSDIFTEEIGSVPGRTVDVPIDPKAAPVFCKARQVPYALQDAVNAEIDRLVANGRYTPTTTSKWATPVVPVVKSNGSIRLAADYSVTINPVCVPKNYPIPNIEQILTDFSGCKYFSKFDVREAYNHLRVSREAAQLLTVNTLKGLFLVNYLMYGYINAPADWQEFADIMVKEIDGCLTFYDDTKVSSATAKDHLLRLRKFFEACRKFNVRLNKGKCVFLTDKLEYLGHSVDKNGIHKTTEKVDAILKAKRPENADELKSFAGLVGYYSRFIPNCSSLFQPFAELKDKFVWNEECEKAFQLIKEEIASDRVLCHFDPKKKLILATDASPYALGAVLSHEDESGERPIAFASRTLTPTETRYSQVDRESLGIYWGVKKFFNYLYGRKFVLLTDCQPLKSILDSKASKPSLSATRLLHYALFLQGFDYTIRYRKASEHGNADFPSRFPVTIGNPNQIDMPTHIHRLQLQTLPVTSEQIASETSKDESISSLYQQLLGNRPVRNFREIHEFSLIDGCIMRGERVYIPPSLRTQILNELHVGHLGVVKCRQLARSFVYWTGIDKDIQTLISTCKQCADNAKNPPKEISHPWLPAKGPWQRVHFDCGEIEGRNLFIIVDSFSRWVEVYVLASTSSAKLIECLDDCFSRLGLPVTCVSDNAQQFVSEEIKNYFRMNGIRRMTSPPYMPSSNGQAEKFVQIIKNGLKSETNGTFIERLQKVLLSYRRAPNVVTGKSPAELLFGRAFRSKLSLVIPGKSTLEPEDSSNPVRRSFNVGQKVYLRMYTGSDKWAIGTIEEKCGKVVYFVRSGDVRHKRHVNQLRPWTGSAKPSDFDFNLEPPVTTGPLVPEVPIPDTSTPSGSTSPAKSTPGTLRSSKRLRKPRVPFSPS